MKVAKASLQRVSSVRKFLLNSCSSFFFWRTSTGFLIAALSQNADVFGIACLIIQFFNFFFGSCLIFNAIAEDISTNVIEFNSAAQTPEGNRFELMERFCALVQLYSDAKQ